MSTRTITGNLATDPEVVQAGSIQNTKLRSFIEATGEQCQGKLIGGGNTYPANQMFI